MPDGRPQGGRRVQLKGPVPGKTLAPIISTFPYGNIVKGERRVASSFSLSLRLQPVEGTQRPKQRTIRHTGGLILKKPVRREFAANVTALGPELPAWARAGDRRCARLWNFLLQGHKLTWPRRRGVACLPGNQPARCCFCELLSSQK